MGIPMASSAGRRGVWLWVVLFLGGVAACTREQPQEQLEAGQKSIILSGELQPYRSVSVTAPISARVTRILVETGDQVSANDSLLQFDATLLQAQVESAEAAVVLAEERLAQARRKTEAPQTKPQVGRPTEAQRRARIQARNAADRQSWIRLENAKTNLERLYPLMQEGVVSRREVDLAENEYADAVYARANLPLVMPVVPSESGEAGASTSLGEGDVRAAAASLKQANAQLTEARYRLAQADLRTPIDGVITGIAVDIGNVPFLHDRLFEIQDIAQVQAEAQLSPGLLPFVYPGQAAEVVVNTTPPTTIAATVERVSTVADAETRFLTLFLVLDNPDRRFQPGYTVRVELAVDPDKARRAAPANE